MEQNVNSNAHTQEAEGESLLSELVFKFLPYWPLFLIMALVGAGVGYIYLRYTTPVYAASANLLIKDEEKGMYESQLTEALNPFGTSKIIENEIVILQSKTLMREVVRNLNLYAPIYSKGRIIESSAYTTSPVIIESRNPEIIKEVTDVPFSYSDSTGKVAIENTYYNLDEWFLYGNDSLRFVSNPSRDTAVKVKWPLYFSLLKLDNAANAYNISASVEVKYSTVINLKVYDEVPERAIDVINELMQVYNKAAVDDKNLLAANTLAFVEQRLRYVVNELDSVEGALQSYKSSQQIVDISSQGQLFLQSVGETDKQVSEIGIQQAVLKQIEDYVMSKENVNPIVPSTFGVSDPVLAQLLNRLYEMETQYNKLKKTTARNNPSLLSLQDQIANLKPTIIENIRSQQQNLSITKNKLQGTSSGLSSALRKIPQKERELLGISRQQAIKNNIYTFLLEKREETALSFGSTVADSRIVDYAESYGPVKPNRNLVYAFAVSSGILMAILLLVFKDFLNDKILYRKEIEKYVSWPIIGEIGYNTSKENQILTSGSRGFIAEQIKHIRTSLSYFGIDKNRKRILITSSISGEGKSFVALNLATSLALTDKKVLLMELDLRLPKLSKYLGISREIGITNYLIGKADVNTIIKESGVHENLSFIPAGPIPPNPSELISGSRMSELMMQLDSLFDYIIIDSAPITLVTDAHILSRHCDITLYIIRHAVTPKIHIKRLQQSDKTRGLKNVSVIFNGIKGRGFSKNTYGYGYGYDQSYGYEYGSAEKSSKSRKFRKADLDKS